MATILDSPPANVKADLDALNAALDKAIPAKRDNDNLLIATWNLRAFASLTEKWTAGEKDSPRRDLTALRTICEIVKRFDVIAVQEVKGDMKAIRHALKFLGERWAFITTDVTLGEAAGGERLAFIFDTKRLKLSGLACELVVPAEWFGSIEKNALTKQFARTPYAVSFKAGGVTFILVTLHIDYGNEEEDRIPELKGIARWMAEWAAKISEWDHNLLTLGDFNIDRKDSPLWQAFTSTGLTVPAELEHVLRSIFADPVNPHLEKFYDQIAWFKAGGASLIGLDYRKGGSFDYLPYVYTGQGLDKEDISYRISDHYPLWVEFGL